jgi:hypothetical protein
VPSAPTHFDVFWVGSFDPRGTAVKKEGESVLHYLLDSCNYSRLVYSRGLKPSIRSLVYGTGAFSARSEPGRAGRSLLRRTESAAMRHSPDAGG